MKTRIRNLGDRLRQLHLIDCDGVCENYLIPRDGILDMKKHVADISSLGYDGNVTIELIKQDIFDSADSPFDHISGIAFTNVDILFFLMMNQIHRFSMLVNEW